MTQRSTPRGSNPAAERITDGQAYVASAELLPGAFVDSIADSLCVWLGAQGISFSRARVYESCSALYDDPLCDRLIKDLDEAGIADAFLMLPDFTYCFTDCRLTIQEMIGAHRQILKRHPGRLYSMIGVDPRWGRDGVDLFERETADDVFSGLKLYPPCGYSPSDPGLFPFYEICRVRSLPVSVHIGASAHVLTLDYAYPRLIDRAAREFPDVNFILSHASTCYVDECIMLCASRPNIYLEISGYQSQPISHLKYLLQSGISHKVIFGTDWPSFRVQGRHQDFVRSILAPGGPVEDLRPFEVERFLSGTARSLLPQNRRRRHSGETVERHDALNVPA